jgi:hypothetical protein
VEPEVYAVPGAADRKRQRPSQYGRGTIDDVPEAAQSHERHDRKPGNGHDHPQLSENLWRGERSK